MIKPRIQARVETRENVDALNLANCNKALLEEIEHDINMSIGECSYWTNVYVKDKDHFYDGYTEEEVKSAQTYLEESLGYSVIISRTFERKPSNHWRININW